MKVWVSLTASGKACFQLGLSPSTRPVLTHTRASREARTEKEGHRNSGRSPGLLPREKENDILKKHYRTAASHLCSLQCEHSRSKRARTQTLTRSKSPSGSSFVADGFILYSQRNGYLGEGAEDMAMLLDARTRFSSKPPPQ